MATFCLLVAGGPGWRSGGGGGWLIPRGGPSIFMSGSAQQPQSYLFLELGDVCGIEGQDLPANIDLTRSSLAEVRIKSEMFGRQVLGKSGTRTLSPGWLAYGSCRPNSGPEGRRSMPRRV
jgi:hypothetical protein